MGEHWMMHCGLEIVLPNGEPLLTGIGALLKLNVDPSKPPREQETNECSSC